MLTEMCLCSAADEIFVRKSRSVRPDANLIRFLMHRGHVLAAYRPVQAGI